MGTLPQWSIIDGLTKPPEGSTVTSGIPDALPSTFTPDTVHFTAQLGSFLFNQTQLLLHLAASDNYLTVGERAWPWTLVPLRSLCHRHLGTNFGPVNYPIRDKSCDPIWNHVSGFPPNPWSLTLVLTLVICPLAPP